MTYAHRYRWARRFERLGAPKSDSGLVVKNTLVLYMRMLVVLFVGLFTSRIQLQALGIENYGLYGVAMATVGLFGFVSGSLSMASSRFLTVEMGKGCIGSVKRVFSTVLCCQFAMACLVAFLLETAGLYVLGTKLNIAPERLFAVKWAFHCGVASTFLTITQVPYGAVIIAHERMSAFAYMTFYDVAAKLAIVYFLFITPFDRLVTYSTLFLLSSATTIVVYRVYCILHFTEARFRFMFDRRIVREISGFIGWQFLSQIAFLSVTQAVTLLNQRYFGPTVVAACSVGTSVYGHVNSFITNFKTAANPQIIKLYAARQFEQSRDILIETVHYSAFLLLILGVPIWLYAPEILRLWLGENVPQYACGFLRVILIGAFFQNFDYSMFTVIYADGRMKYNTFADLVFYPLAFAAIWFCAIAFKNPYTTALGQAFLAVALALAVKPTLLHFMSAYQLRDFVRMFGPPFAALALCGGMGYFVYSSCPNGLWWLVPDCALMAGLNAVLVFSLVASERVQSQMLRLLCRMGTLGRFVSGVAEGCLGRVRHVRRKLRIGQCGGVSS